jgi:phenylpyruvate tautomerase PptA (4-oxalocrotonate tautomerase family)
MARVTFVKGALDGAQKADLAEKMTAALLEIEGGADTPGGRSIAWVLFNEVDNDAWAVGGRFDDTYVSAAGKFLVSVTVPEGSMSQERKSMVHKFVNDAILEVTGTAGVPQAGRSVWVHIHEIPEGHWGTSGKTASITGIATIAGVAPDSELLDFTGRYFAAKERAYEASGHPEDATGRLRLAVPTAERDRA